MILFMAAMAAGFFLTGFGYGVDYQREKQERWESRKYDRRKRKNNS